MLVLPVLILGKDLAAHFWRSIWFFVPLIVFIQVFINVFFALNYRIYSLLEKEDWPALVQELKKQIFSKGRYRSRLVTLLINTHLVLSEIQAITELEKELTAKSKNKNPVNHNALGFGAARIVQKDFQGAADFFGSRINGSIPCKAADAEWLRWYHGFSLFLSRRFEEAAAYFIILAREGKESIPSGLSAYFLHKHLSTALPLRSAELEKEAENGKNRITLSVQKKSGWDREVKHKETEIYAVILSSYIQNTGDYLYN